MKSNWEITRARSQYHFDTTRMDPRWDTVIELGHIEPAWSQELEQVAASAHPVTWRTRGRNNDPLKRGAEEYDQEEYDLDLIGMPRDFKVTDLNYDVPPVFQHISDLFGMDRCMTRIHVQRPGQLWNLHLDKLEKWLPEDPGRVGRYFVQLTDWQPGHFWCYGNYQWSGWRAGSVTTFDWINVPHATANAGQTYRATLQLTGIITEQTRIFLQQLAHESYQLARDQQLDQLEPT